MIDEILRSGFAELGLKLEDNAVERYAKYAAMLTEANRVMNLTAIEGDDNIARLHFLDCAALLGVADFGKASVIDIGTGAGFPGLALKIACPDMSMTLLDSLDKRIGFLRSTCEALGFDDVECVHARAEELPEGFRGHFDIAVSRAVARLNVLCEMCLPYVRQGGCFIAMKGPDCAEELNEARSAIHLLGGKAGECIAYTVPGTDITHSAVIIHKVQGTPAKYPRRWAQIKKQPL